MSTKNKAYSVIAAIVVVAGLIMSGVHFIATQGQVMPASMTNGATKSDQRDATVSSDVANHQTK